MLDTENGLVTTPQDSSLVGLKWRFLEVDLVMESLGRKRKVVREVVDSKKSFRQIVSLRGADNPYLSHLSLEDGHQDRKKRKDAHEICPRAVVSVPASRKGCLPDKPARGLKRKGGCINPATRFGRKKKLDKDYELGSVLGQGKFGVVKACRNRTTGQERACKTLPKKTEENIHKEVEIMQHLSGHPNVVTLSAVYEDEESLHLVMELCHSGRLSDEISRIGRYSEHQAANVIKELMVVVKYCHQMGVVHRDIKPENILRSATGQLKLADFGLSMRIVDGQKMCGVVGSPSYVAPEVLAGTYTEKVDVWAAGVILHVLLLGTLPFRGNSVENIFKAIKEVNLDFQSGPWLSISSLGRDLASRMLSRDVQKRPSPEEVFCHPWIVFYTESLKAARFRSGKLVTFLDGGSQKKAQKREAPPKWENESLDLSLEERSPLSANRKRGFQPSKVEAPLELDIVDVLTTAISRIRLSEPKRSRICLHPFPATQQCSSNFKINMCAAF